MRLLTVLIILFISYSANGQKGRICTLSPYTKSEYSSEKISIFNDMSEAKDAIDSLLKAIQLPMNFQIKMCNNIYCRENASASMDDFGTREITFDNDWFNRINSDSNRIEALSILAHELGHHLAGHTLFLAEKKYEEAILNCKEWNNPYYNKSKCRTYFQADYSEYLKESRKIELQADRFAGFIMNKFGANLTDVKRTFEIIADESDDTNSTHPKLSKRLLAVEDGFNLANTKRKVELFEIKGYPFEYILPDTSLANQIARKKKRHELISKLQQKLTFEPILKINQKSNNKFNWTFDLEKNEKTRENISNYLKTDFKFDTYKNGDEVFEIFRRKISLHFASKYFFNYQIGYHLKDGAIKIFNIQDNKMDFIYKSDISKISFDEIEVLLISILNSNIENHFQME